MLLTPRRLVAALAALPLLMLAPPGLSAAETAATPTAAPSAQEVTRTPTAPPAPWPPVLQVFKDTFDTDKTYASYTGLGGANVYIAGGRLHVDIPSDASREGAGLRMRLPKDGTPVRCSGFTGLQIPSLGDGSLHWTLFGFDAATGKELVLMELEITESSGLLADILSFRYVKDGKGVYAHIETGKKASDIKEIRWDTRNGGREVQAEVTFKDGTRASSDWIDPEESTIAGFDITTDGGELSADGAAGLEVHAEGDAAPDLPAPIERFDSDALTALYPHWLVQAHDADAIVVATVARVDPPVTGSLQQVRPSHLPVHYFLDEALHGHPGAERFVVHHDLDRGLRGKSFAPGTQLILFLHHTDDGLRDFGRPTGVIPAGEVNYRAVVSRVNLIHGRSEP